MNSRYNARIYAPKSSYGSISRAWTRSSGRGYDKQRETDFNNKLFECASIANDQIARPGTREISF